MAALCKRHNLPDRLGRHRRHLNKPCESHNLWSRAAFPNPEPPEAKTELHSHRRTATELGRERQKHLAGPHETGSIHLLSLWTVCWSGADRGLSWAVSGRRSGESVAFVLSSWRNRRPLRVGDGQQWSLTGERGVVLDGVSTDVRVGVSAMACFRLSLPIPRLHVFVNGVSGDATHQLELVRVEAGRGARCRGRWRRGCAT